MFCSHPTAALSHGLIRVIQGIEEHPCTHRASPGWEQRWCETCRPSGGCFVAENRNTFSGARMKYCLEVCYSSLLVLFHRSVGCRIISGAEMAVVTRCEIFSRGKAKQSF